MTTTEAVCVTGSKGSTGATGEKGDKGDKGDTGAQGLRGLQGEKGDQGIQGPAGQDGISSYTHIAYANSSDGITDFTASNSDREYIGIYVDSTPADSTNPADYLWSKIKGADGANGTPGKAGVDGKTPYLHIAYANNDTGTSGFSVSDSANKLYIGQYTDFTQADSTDPTKYSWTKIKGEQGAQGEKGETGEQGKGVKSTVITYQICSSGTSAPTGTWSAAIPATTAKSPYLWTKTVITYTDNTTSTIYSVGSTLEGVEEIITEQGDELRTQITDQYTNIISECENIILEASKTLVETSDFESFKETVETQLEVVAGEISMNFTTTNSRIDEVDDKIDSEITSRNKHISFSDNGIAITAGEGQMTIRVDNDIVTFEKDGKQFGWWDGVDFHTGNIVVDLDERAQFGDFAFVPRSDGSLSFLKVFGG